MLYLLTYGCSISEEKLVVSADNEEIVNSFGCQAAEECWYSYDSNYANPEDYEGYNEEELTEVEFEDMVNDTFWHWDKFDENDEEHQIILKEQRGIPFEI